jgi:hypothetical protein
MNRNNHETAYSVASGSSAPNSRRKKIIILVVIIAVAAVAVFTLLSSGIIELNRYKDSISMIEKQTDPSNAAVTNYYPILADEVNWGTVDDEERSGIAEYAVGKALAQARDDSAADFNIMGISPARDPVFLYDASDDSIQIYVDKIVTKKIPLS